MSTETLVGGHPRKLAYTAVEDKALRSMLDEWVKPARHSLRDGDTLSLQRQKDLKRTIKHLMTLIEVSFKTKCRLDELHFAIETPSSDARPVEEADIENLEAVIRKALQRWESQPPDGRTKLPTTKDDLLFIRDEIVKPALQRMTASEPLSSRMLRNIRRAIDYLQKLGGWEVGDAADLDDLRDAAQGESAATAFNEALLEQLENLVEGKIEAQASSVDPVVAASPSATEVVLIQKPESAIENKSTEVPTRVEPTARGQEGTLASQRVNGPAIPTAPPITDVTQPPASATATSGAVPPSKTMQVIYLAAGIGLIVLASMKWKDQQTIATAIFAVGAVSILSVLPETNNQIYRKIGKSGYMTYKGAVPLFIIVMAVLGADNSVIRKLLGIPTVTVATSAPTETAASSASVVAVAAPPPTSSTNPIGPAATIDGQVVQIGSVGGSTPHSARATGSPRPREKLSTLVCKCPKCDELIKNACQAIGDELRKTCETGIRNSKPECTQCRCPP